MGASGTFWPQNPLPMQKALTIAATLVLTIVVLDHLLPPDRLETTVYGSSLHADTGPALIYDIPDSGGGIASCAVSPATLQQLPNKSEIVVSTSAIFGRCTGVQAFVEPQDIDRPKFIEAAIRYAYQDAYANLKALSADYPGFTPVIRQWGSDAWFLSANSRRYSVLLPKALVVMDAAGAPKAMRTCGTSEGRCVAVQPARTGQAFVSAP
jgi:hypothetical protein